MRTRISRHLAVFTLLTVVGIGLRAAWADEPGSAPAKRSTTSSPASAPASEPTSREAGQWWSGTVVLPGQNLDFTVRFRAGEAGAVQATIDIPAQGAKNLRLDDVVFDDEHIRFSITSSGANFEYAREPNDTATGKLLQHGMTLKSSMHRVSAEEAAHAGPPRPQMPKPPFPYAQREVTYENPADSAKLAGTLTIPEGHGPFPAVVLITGSGAQDRDETIFGHKPFLVLADHLTRAGIAVLRSDDRGVGGSTGASMTMTTETFVGDVACAVDLLKKQPDIDARRIGLIGHSEGGLIAPILASSRDDIALIVMLAGPGAPGDELLGQQIAALLRVEGRSDEQIDEQVRAQRAVFKLLKSDAPEEELRTATRAFIRVQNTQANPGAAVTEESLDEQMKIHFPLLLSPWMRTFVRLDPRDFLVKVRCPVLALGGTLDLQVPADKNLPEIERALAKGGNKQVVAKALPKLNHLFQEAQTGSVAEYATIEQTFAPAALDEITSWLRAQFRAEKERTPESRP